MKFELEFSTDNATFEDGEAEEVARILETAARRVRNGDVYGKVSDVNGNTVGSFGFTDADES